MGARRPGAAAAPSRPYLEVCAARGTHPASTASRSRRGARRAARCAASAPSGARGARGRGVVAALTVRGRADGRPERGRPRVAPRRRAVVLLRAARPRRRARSAGARLRRAAIDAGGAGPLRARSPSAWRAAGRRRGRRPARRPAGAGLVAAGGFAFAPDGGGAPHWAGFAPGVAARARGRARAPRARRAPDRRRARRAGRHRRGRRSRASSSGSPSCARAPLPLLDPAPAGRSRIASAMPPEHYEAAVARAVERIRAGAFEKIVLAREVAVHAPRAARPRRGVRRPARGFPALLRLLRRPRRRRLRRRHAGAARAARGPARARPSRSPGSTRRSADPAVDDHLGEQLLRSRQGPRGAGDRRAPDRAGAAPARVWVTARRRAGDRPASRTSSTSRRRSAPSCAQPRSRDRARRPAAPDARRRRRAARGRDAADPGARGPRPRLVRRPGRLDRRQRGRRVLRRAALRAAARRRARAATPASASCATPTRRPSWPRPRSSSQALLPVLAG